MAKSNKLLSVHAWCLGKKPKASHARQAHCHELDSLPRRDVTSQVLRAAFLDTESLPSWFPLTPYWTAFGLLSCMLRRERNLSFGCWVRRVSRRWLWTGTITVQPPQQHRCKRERLTSLPEEHRLTGLWREERPLLSYKPESIAPSIIATFLQKLALWWVYLACSEKRQERLSRWPSPRIWQWDTAEESIPHTTVSFSSFSSLGSASTTVKPPGWPRLPSTFLFLTSEKQRNKPTTLPKAAPGRFPYSLPLWLTVTDFNLQDSLCSGEPLQEQKELETGEAMKAPTGLQELPWGVSRLSLKKLGSQSDLRLHRLRPFLTPVPVTSGQVLYFIFCFTGSPRNTDCLQRYVCVSLY